MNRSRQHPKLVGFLVSGETRRSPHSNQATPRTRRVDSKVRADKNLFPRLLVFPSPHDAVDDEEDETDSSQEWNEQDPRDDEEDPEEQKGGAVLHRR